MAPFRRPDRSSPSANMPLEQQPAPPPAGPPGLAEEQFPDKQLPQDQLPQEPIRLHSERLIVDRQRRKVGEVVVRKEIETELVQVPVRREKLVIEQVSPEYEQIAVVPLGAREMLSPTDHPGAAETPATVQAEFTSARLASQFLAQVAEQPGYGRIQIKIELADPSLEPQPISNG